MKKLYFDISTGLKNVIGSHLITQDEVAVFELVKNSFDADATKVDLYFDDDSFIIADNGNGMSLEEIKTKWLFVAYSNKRKNLKFYDHKKDTKLNRHYAGSKGIGRFSTDRLGSIVTLQSKSLNEEINFVHQIKLDWRKFDIDHSNKFSDVEIDYQDDNSDFDLPKYIKKSNHGTVIKIERLKNNWDRSKLKKLKASLSKLINPVSSAGEQFKIFIHAPNETTKDRIILTKIKDDVSHFPNEIIHNNQIINGEVNNFVFKILEKKTTYLTVKFSENGSHIISTLIDRGETVYKIKEPNIYKEIEKSSFYCQLFFLNKTAKINFTRQVGIRPVNFGSVFLFRNEFRILPIGDKGNDWLGINQRHQQGYARYLGSRNLIGRIDITDTEDIFQEATSRDSGLLESNASIELRELFFTNCLLRLERYVVPVLFPDKENNESEDITRLLIDPSKARIANVLAKLIKNNEVELLSYSEKLVGILNERSQAFEGSIADLNQIAEKTNNPQLKNKIIAANIQFLKLKTSKDNALKIAKKEQSEKIKAQKSTENVKNQLVSVTKKLKIEKERILFLTSISSMDAETAINLHHQITIYSVAIEQEIENYFLKNNDNNIIDKHQVENTLESIMLYNKKIGSVARFATKAGFLLDSEYITASLSNFITQYITEIAIYYLGNDFDITTSSDGKSVLFRFKPIEITIIIDNLISNSQKSNATNIHFDLSHPDANRIYIRIADDGNGINIPISDRHCIFDKGYTTTDGSGLGLFHVRQILGEMNGTIQIVPTEIFNKLLFEIRIVK